MTDTEKLRDAIAKSGYKMCFVAQKIGISYQSLLNKMNNTTDFKPCEIKTLCNLLGINDLAEMERIFFA